MNRSYLFVPADSERKMQKAGQSGADALILDLEDSIIPDARPDARQLSRDFASGKADVWIRINPIGSDDAMADLEAVMPSAPAGIMLPKARSAADAQTLSDVLDTLEQANDIEVGTTQILPLCSERPEALFTLDSYVDTTPRLSGLTWGAEDLSAAVGATANRDDEGSWLAPYALARSLCLFAAAAAEVAAIDSVYTDYRNTDGLALYAANSRRDGFSGMLAIHPDQVDVINRAFVPTAAELERAQRIVELFEANPGVGTLGMDGEMFDRPHLVQAQRLLQLAKRRAAL